MSNTKKPLKRTPLTPAQFEQNRRRQLPAIARQHDDRSPTTEPTVEPTVVVDGGGAADGVEWAAGRVRQMVVWEHLTDQTAVESWLAAVTPLTPESTGSDLPAAGVRDSPTGLAGPAAESLAGGEGALWRVTTTAPALTREERLRCLATYMTRVGRGDPNVVLAVLEAAAMVAGLVVEFPYVSLDADRWLLSLGARFGAWVMDRTIDGTYDAYRDLTENHIAAFVGQLPVTTGTKSTYTAALRRLAAGPTRAHVGSRRMAQPPYLPVLEATLWAVACGVDPHSWRHHASKTLLAVTFGTGASAAELVGLEPGDVLVLSDGSVRIRLARRGMWVRDVPVTNPDYAGYLAERAEDLAGHPWLFRPERSARPNTCNATVTNLAKTVPIFKGFDPRRARNTWAVNALAAGIPFAAWCHAAGVGPGTHLPTDLLPHLPAASPDDVAAAFHSAFPAASHTAPVGRND